MKTYNSYEEAKIANPDYEIVTATQKNITENRVKKTFAPVIKSDNFVSGYEYLHDRGTSPMIDKGYFELCNPADHCITVEEFLKAGHRFVEGDIVTNLNGGVSIIKPACDCKGWDYSLENIHKADDDDYDRYILRAAALEKPKRVKVEYVKVEDSIFDLKEEFDREELYVLPLIGNGF